MEFRKKVSEALEYAKLRGERLGALREERISKLSLFGTFLKMVFVPLFIWGGIEAVKEELYYIDSVSDFGLSPFVYLCTAGIILAYDLIKYIIRSKKAKVINARLREEIIILNRKIMTTTGLPEEYTTYQALSRFHYYLTHGIADTYSECARTYHNECETNRIVESNEMAAAAAWDAGMAAERAGNKAARAIKRSRYY